MSEGMNLYNTIYNPDVLSCIANLSNDEVFTPPDVANAMLDMLPQELFSDPNATFLDPACKSGVFLREIAKRLLIGLESTIPNLQERVDHIFQHQLYGIAITELTSLLSRRSLYCSKYPNSKYSVSTFDDVQGNVRFKNTPHRWSGGKCIFCGAAESEYGGKKREGMETHAYEFIHTIKPQEIWKMKFDVIIGNPPYQLSTASENIGVQAKPLYDKFFFSAEKLSPKYIVMITPSRWFAAGWGLDEFRNKMIKDNRIRELHDFPVSNDCFTGVAIKGGVSYFLYDKDYCGECRFVTHSGNGIVSESKRYLQEEHCEGLIRYNEMVSIFHKVMKKEGKGFTPMSNIVTGRSPFGFNTNHHGDAIKRANDDVLYLERSGFTYMPKKSISRRLEDVDKYKVYISNAYGAGEGFPHQIINKPILGKPNTICSGTYLMIGPFSSELQANNAISYIATKFFRALVMINKVSQHASYLVYQAVPIQDFSEEWTDKKLYDKYGITEEEIEYIDRMIRPMDLNGGEDNA